MSYYRNFARKIFGPYLHLMKPATAQRWLYINRIIYGMSSAYLCHHFYKRMRSQEQKELLPTGKPIIQDHSEGEKTEIYLMNFYIFLLIYYDSNEVKLLSLNTPSSQLIKGFENQMLNMQA